MPTILDSNCNAFASNRDEFLKRDTSRADFWDLDPILKEARQAAAHGAATPDALTNTAHVGIISGQDLQPAKTQNYTIEETESVTSADDSNDNNDTITANGLHTRSQDKVTLSLSTEHLPGTWLGITTHGDLVALTNYRELDAYYVEHANDPPKLSRGKVCGEYLVTMAAAHDDLEKKRQAEAIAADTSTQDQGDPPLSHHRAERWFRKRAVGWEDEFEGLNLLVVQNGGDRQVVGGNREDSEVKFFSNAPNADSASDAAVTTETGEMIDGSSDTNSPIRANSIVGVSNSVFTRPWTKVEIGVDALGRALNDSVQLFGTERHAKLQQGNGTSDQESIDDDQRELAWLVIEMLTLLRVHTSPFVPEELTLPGFVQGLRKRVFIPKVESSPKNAEYGTRSSTIVLFGQEREDGKKVAVFVEKKWYSSCDPKTDERVLYSADSAEGLVWWQGFIGDPREKWVKIEGDDLKKLLQSARKWDVATDASDNGVASSKLRSDTISDTEKVPAYALWNQDSKNGRGRASTRSTASDAHWRSSAKIVEF
ncbi:hypothetical protein BGW38_001425 [Lunasporangiospora selenospora]|uniref:Uncharacterized protein n=1 Tax=Lunasporangiospora selenospora TaxID=979761 RepID=A0A9P6KI12_9FUNG|nr:hypothetical protein BGW38_001425 [Lunasporangiospora selenospora]